MLAGMWISGILSRVRLLTQRRRARLARARLLPRGGRGPMRVVHTDAVVHETFSRRSWFVQRGARVFAKPMLQLMPVTDRSISVMRGVDRFSSRGPRSRFVERMRFELGGVPVESMIHRYGTDSDMTILYLHGGGFLSCGIDSHRRLCERLALRTGATVISADYVQLPDGTVADSVQDAINVYTALVKTVAHPDKIVVAGDSAGGYLTMKVGELATRRKLPRPAALIGFSPLLSLDPDSVDKGIEQIVRHHDAYLPMTKIARLRPRWMPDGAEMEGEVSPLDATKWITSPTFLIATEDEILRAETEAMAIGLTARGVDVELHLWRKQIHAFPVLADLIPEAEQAIGLAAEFARRSVGEADPQKELAGDTAKQRRRPVVEQ